MKHFAPTLRQLFPVSLFIFVLLFIMSVFAADKKDCLDSDKDCLRKISADHPITKESYWKPYLSKPIDERVFIATAEMVDYAILMNRLDDYPERPVLPNPPEDFLKDVKQAFTELPSSIKQLLEKNFVGIFIFEELGGSALADYIYNDKKEKVGAYIFLNMSQLIKRKANEWATWKESTPFVPDATYKLEATIAYEADNNRKNAIQYILLHELGHVVSMLGHFHPPWNLRPKEIISTKEYPFFNISWQIDKKNDHYVAQQFPLAKDMVYYTQPKLDAKKMLTVYQQLEKSKFPTLYAATHPGDDWAESFVTYVHSVLMKRPFEIRLKQDDQVIKKFNLCWGQKRCAEKEKILIDFLKQ